MKLPRSYEESVFTKAAQGVAVAVAAVYLIGYLVLRTEITMLGIPTGVDAFDHRYLFAGASWVLYTLQAAVSVLPGAVVLAGLLAASGRLLQISSGRGWYVAERLTRRDVQAGTLQLLSIALAVWSAWTVKPWIASRDLLLRDNPSAPVWSLLASSEPGKESFAVYFEHLFVLIASGMLIAVAWHCSRRGSFLLGAALLATGVQTAVLPVLYGALNVVRERPRMKAHDGQSGILVWEDNESYVMVTHSERTLVRLAKDEVKKVEFRGVERLMSPTGPLPGGGSAK